ncbi:hypothetical protein P0D73_36995 [Paraburkholderia sp. RL18-101-BIB-B]|uniref:hypothetical protein n=1 Tax=unclassified Paraburkholderia TaxID=2615204 RepID=UPI0038BD7E98
MTALLPVSNDRWTNTLLLTGELACAKAVGPIDIMAAPTAALTAIMCTSAPALRAVGRAFNYVSFNVRAVRNRLQRAAVLPLGTLAQKIEPALEVPGKRGEMQSAAAEKARPDQSSPSYGEEGFMLDYRCYSI